MSCRQIVGTSVRALSGSVVAGADTCKSVAESPSNPRAVLVVCATADTFPPMAEAPARKNIPTDIALASQPQTRAAPNQPIGAAPAGLALAVSFAAAARPLASAVPMHSARASAFQCRE